MDTSGRFHKCSRGVKRDDDRRCVTQLMNQPDDPRILVVRPGALGDTILGVPLLNSIVERNAGASLTILGTDRYRFLMPPGTEFHSIDHRDWLWLFRSETSKQCSNPPKFRKAYLILTQPDLVAENLKNAGTLSVASVPSRPPGRIHVVEHLHQGLGLPTPSRKPALTHLRPNESRPIVWFHPGSGGPRKCVPLDAMITLARRLRDALGWDLAVTAGEEDEFLKDDPTWARLMNGSHTQLLENRPFEELCETLGGARLFVGNDSGIGHLAANLGIPSAVLFVSTDPVHWAPWVPKEQVRVMDLRDRALTAEVLRNEAGQLIRWADGIH